MGKGKDKKEKKKFQGAKRSAQKAVVADAESKNIHIGGGGGYVSFHSVDEGKNIFRMAPPHNPDHPSYEACRTTMLDCEVEVRDKEGNPTGEKEIKRKKIYVATQHLDGAEIDPTELYIKYVSEYANEAYDDKEERKKYLKHITGYKGPDKKWVWGIIPGTSYVGYAWKKGVLGRIDLWKKWTDEMEKEAANLDSDDTIIVDPFSDPEEGYPLSIEKAKNDKGKFEYTVKAVIPGKKESWEDFFESNALTDKMSEELAAVDSLHDMYTNNYTMRDFDLALDGLKRFDKKHGYDVFKNEDFLEELAEFKKTVPVKDDSEKSDSEKSGKKDKKEKKDKKDKSEKEGKSEESEKSEKKDKKGKKDKKEKKDKKNKKDK